MHWPRKSKNLFFGVMVCVWVSGENGVVCFMGGALQTPLHRKLASLSLCSVNRSAILLLDMKFRIPDKAKVDIK